MEVFVLCNTPCFYINTTKVLMNMKHWIELFPVRLLGMIFKRLIMHMFRKQSLLDVLQIGAYKNFAKFIGKHLRWSLCNLILKT